jgi:hypothetical protein
VRIALGAVLWATVAVAGTACTTLGGDPVPVPQPGPAQQPATGQWTVDSREHVDLWLHSFALLESVAGIGIRSSRRGSAGTSCR